MIFTQDRLRKRFRSSSLCKPPALNPEQREESPTKSKARASPTGKTPPAPARLLFLLTTRVFCCFLWLFPHHFRGKKPFLPEKIAQVLETQGAIADSSCPLEVPFAPRSSNTQVLIVSGSSSYRGPRGPQPAQVLALNLKKKKQGERGGETQNLVKKAGGGRGPLGVSLSGWICS